MLPCCPRTPAPPHRLRHSGKAGRWHWRSWLRVCDCDCWCPHRGVATGSPTLTCSQPYQGPGIRIGPLVQEELGDAVVAAVCGDVEGRQVVQRDVVHRRLVLQQVLHTLHVVPLRGHVQRRQPILCAKTKPAIPGQSSRSGSETRHHQFSTSDTVVGEKVFLFDI